MQLSAFLISLPGQKTLFNATPREVCRFLACKDSCGETQHPHILMPIPILRAGVWSSSPMSLSTSISESSVPFLTKLVGMAIGALHWLWGTLWLC